MSTNTASKTQQTCTFVEFDAHWSENGSTEPAEQKGRWAGNDEDENRATDREEDRRCTIIEVHPWPRGGQERDGRACGGWPCDEMPCDEQPDKSRPQNQRPCGGKPAMPHPQSWQPNGEHPRGAHARPVQTAENCPSVWEDQIAWPKDGRTPLPRHARGTVPAAADPQTEGALATPGAKTSSTTLPVNVAPRLADLRARVAAALRGVWHNMQGIEYKTTKSDRIFGAACGILFAALSFAVAAL